LPTTAAAKTVGCAARRGEELLLLDREPADVDSLRLGAGESLVPESPLVPKSPLDPTPPLSAARATDCEAIALSPSTSAMSTTSHFEVPCLVAA
jgi:hypothetical protein